MTVTTTAAAAAPDTEKSAQEKSAALVENLRERLHQAARDERLTDEYANGIVFGLVGPNVALDPARALILFAHAIEQEARARRTAPEQDCGNPMGQTNVPSCAENVLVRHEGIAAAALAEALVTGPWPLDL